MRAALLVVMSGVLAGSVACDPTYECLDDGACDRGGQCRHGRCVLVGTTVDVVSDGDGVGAADDVAADGGVDADVAAPRVSQLSAGGDHTCALFDDGRLICWGRRDYLQIGDGDAARHALTAPVVVAGLDDVVQVSAGALHTCARTTAGEVYCWGQNTTHECSPATDALVAEPRLVPLPGAARDVSSTYHATCAVMAQDGSAWCWGFVLDGQLYQGGSNWRAQREPAMVAGLEEPVVRVYTGGYSACAEHASGALSCWGANDSGQLAADDGVGEASASAVAARLPAGLGAIDPGINHYCGLDAGGGVLCWGRNTLGATGAGADVVASASAEPLAEPLAEAALGVDGGMSQSCAHLASGKVACWGAAGTDGLLGLAVDGSASGIHHVAPQMIAGLDEVRALALGYRHACALSGANTVRCWGSNDSAELGTGEASPGSNVPVEVDLSPFFEK